MEQQSKTKQRSATERIEDLERGLMALFNNLENMNRDMLIIKDAIKLLGNKVDSIVKASQRGDQVNDEVISKIMVENNVEELKQKVAGLVSQGLLKSEETVSTTSFVVGRELDEKGEVANPRMQFIVSQLDAPEDVKSKFLGAKIGDVLVLQEGKWKFEVMESYSIQQPQLQQEEQMQEQTQEQTEEQSSVEAAN